MINSQLVWNYLYWNQYYNTKLNGVTPISASWVSLLWPSTTSFSVFMENQILYVHFYVLKGFYKEEAAYLFIWAFSFNHHLFLLYWGNPEASWAYQEKEEFIRNTIWKNNLKLLLCSSLLNISSLTYSDHHFGDRWSWSAMPAVISARKSERKAATHRCIGCNSYTVNDIRLLHSQVSMGITHFICWSSYTHSQNSQE